MCSSWPRPQVRLSPLLAHAYLVPSLFVLAHPAACCLFQRLVFHTYIPPFTTRRFNTFIQANILGAQYNMYNRHIYSLQLFLSCFFLTSGQACWPRTFMSGTLGIYSLGLRYNPKMFLLNYVFSLINEQIRRWIVS